MKRWSKRTAAFLAALLMTVSLVRYEGAAALKGVYFTAVNDQLLTLNSETMPFWLGNQLYVSQVVFEDTDIGIKFARNYSRGLAVLFTSKTDLRFDLVNQTIYDKEGAVYEGGAIEKNGYVFFPLDTVCRFFGLKWSVSSTETIPLIRIRSASAMLDDRGFIAAAASMMASRYAEYEKLINESKQPEENNPDEGRDPAPEKDPEPEKDPVVTPPPVHAVAGQKVYLLISGLSGESVRETMGLLGATPATFLLTVQQMEDGDLLRALLGSGHGVALMVQSKTEDEIRLELDRARELTWKASCSLLQLVWYEGKTDLSALLEEQGCVLVSADIDRRGTALRSESDADALLRLVGKRSEDMSVYLGHGEDCTEGLDALLQRLSEAQYRLCAWRLTA